MREEKYRRLWYMPVLLELFSGTGSVGNVARDLGWTVMSLDMNEDAAVDCITNIMDWEYTLVPKAFDFIWASPPCTEYSTAKTVGRGSWRRLMPL